MSVRLHIYSVALALALAVLTGGPATPAFSQTAASELTLNASLRIASQIGGACPPNSPDALLCPGRTGQGAAPGLGAVAETYSFLVYQGAPRCSEGTSQVLGYPVRWIVRDKGAIDFALAEVPQCFTEALSVDQKFTVTGGTGIYAGASGSGIVARALSLGDDGNARGRETWTGTLTVPGLDFDVTAPTFAGAVDKTVRAKRGTRRIRVTFRVTARDDRDGAVPATCIPRSGSSFKVGRTRVACEATDSSANSVRKAFTVIVKPAR